MKYSLALKKNRWVLALLGVPAVFLVLFILLVISWIWDKNQRLHNHLEQVQQRYMRLSALEQQGDQVSAALQMLNKIQQQNFYGSQNDAAQVGNALQQELRAVMVKAGLVVSSSQVQSGAADASEDALPYESVKILMSVDGSWEAVQKALQSLQVMKPVVTVEELVVQLNGPLHGQNPAAEPRLMTRWVFVALRSKGSV